ncbi:sorbitol dehydrogenase [Culex quinquefasciatus]|uniref:Sorbitol dehydrogenase n=2 Tax=Culex pipiens complex TaxID=518105 RepID=B0X1N7_CULQU|nr:sorbitol dehydrogenase [Culex quinquefasciatus]|eukprot:XP_001863559.1 sorbitol dehydrogenase [Culex quinquefasciatus]
MSGKDNLTAVLYGIEDLRLEQRPIPTPKDDEVLLEMDSVGICGSDVHYLVNGRIGDFVVRKPMVIGHEASGIVAKVGSRVHNVRVGDRVAIEPGYGCRVCDYCKGGRYNLCPEMIFCATPPYDGNLTRYYTHPADFCYKLPDHSRTAPERLDVAKELGADGTLVVERGADEQDVVKKVHALFGGHAPDKTIDCSGAEATSRLSVLATRSGGCAVLVGMGPAEIKLPLVNALSREVDIRGVFRYCNDYPGALSLVASGKINVKRLITHHFNIEETAEAFNTSRHGLGGAIKVMIHVQPKDKNNPK